MFTDIVGYSKMVEKNEKNALMLLDEHNQILTSIIKEFDGKIIKFIGDSIFAEFNKSLNCAKSAIKIQAELCKRNELSRENEKILIRIGIHTGKFFIKDDDLFGNDVNMCSRFEGAAPPGGISTTSAIAERISENDDH